jgi:dienelactone hydrolase
MRFRIPLFLSVLASLLGAAAAPAAGAGSPLWGQLVPGPYAVGFRQIERYDHSRAFRPPVDLTGEPVAGERSRPLRISVWYPAEGAEGAEGPPGQDRTPLTLGDYITLLGAEAHLGPVTAADAAAGRQAFYRFPLLDRSTPEQRQRLEALPSRAVREARPAAGKFPLLLYSLGSAAVGHVTPELLASHGYVVAQAPRLGAFAGLPQDGRDRLDLETKIRDFDFVLNAMSEIPSADLQTLGALGFSAGGRWALSLAMKNWNVKAVVGLDTVMLFDDAVSREWRSLPFYDPDAVRVPVLHLVRRAWVPQETSDLWSRLRCAERTHLVFEDPGLDHLDFQSIGYAMTLAGMRPDVAPAVAETFHRFNRATLAFFDLHLKGRQGPQIAAAVPGAITATVLPPLPAPWTDAQFFTTLDRLGVAETLALYRRQQRAGSQPPLSEATLNLAGYIQLLTGNVPEAIEVFALNAEVFPRSANALDSLADGYLAAGDRSRARELTERALTLLEADTSLPAERRARIRESIEARLKALTPSPAAASGSGV